MLEHDLEYPAKRRLHCSTCQMELLHFRSGLERTTDAQGNTLTLLQMECRSCETRNLIPAGYLGTGRLSRLIVRRVDEPNSYAVQ